MRWEKAGGIGADAEIDNLFKSACWTYRQSINPKWNAPEFLRDELGHAYMIEFNTGHVVAILSSGCPNTGRFEKPMFWIGTP